MAETQVTQMMGLFITTAILLSVGVVILGNSTNNCTGIPDYRAPNFVSSVTVTNQGVNYTSPPTVAFSGGHGAAATAVLTADKVTSITVTNPGSGYTTTPSVTFSGGSGVNAAGTAVMSSTQTGWAGACNTTGSNTISGYQLLGVVMIVLAAVIILAVLKYM